MGLLPLTEKGKPVSCQADWPLFYMNDFSKLGIVVSQLDAAVAALQENGCRILMSEQGCLVDVADLAQMEDVFAALAERRLDYEMADLVSCVYQG